jgi:hypothetical protein
MYFQCVPTVYIVFIVLFSGPYMSHKRDVKAILITGIWIRVRFLALPDFLRSNGSGTGPLSLVSTSEELLDRKGRCSGLENRDYGHEDPSH